jgi:hypothetical protein
MLKHKLAQQLRRRQYALGDVEREMIDALSDDQIIDCYITCSCCGKKQVEGHRLETAIARAKDAADFFRVCDRLAKRHLHSEQGPET